MQLHLFKPAKCVHKIYKEYFTCSKFPFSYTPFFLFFFIRFCIGKNAIFTRFQKYKYYIMLNG